MIKILTLLMMFCSTAAYATAVTIDADYPGGNIIVDRIDGDTVTLQQDLTGNARWWFYWNFRVSDVAAGRTLTFRFTNKNVFGTQGPAVSEKVVLRGPGWAPRASKGIHSATHFRRSPSVCASPLRCPANRPI